MPNWCDNEVRIYCESEKILEEVKNFCKGEIESEGEIRESSFCFGSIMPEPNYEETPVARAFPFIKAQFAKTDKERDTIMKNKPEVREGSWWDWRVQNWGTKWEAIELNYEEDGNEIQMNFLTAWSPPEGIYEALIDKFGNNIRISWFYREDGNSLAGYLGQE